MDESPQHRHLAADSDRPDPGGAGLSPTAAVVLLAAVVVGLGAWASWRGWIPTGDDAFLSMRSRHLLSTDPILLNNASSGGPSAGSQYNHPGAFPLLALAVFTLVGGPGAVALATAVVNAGWIALSATMVGRIAGPVGEWVAVVTMAVLVWSMGAEVLVDPWNPNYAMWPVVALVVATWGVQQGHSMMLPIAVVAGSFAFQTHLSLASLAVITVGWALLWVLVRWRPARPEAVRRESVRALLVAAVVGLGANAQLLADQFFGTGNLGKVLRGSEFSEATVTASQALGVLASKLVLVPLWLRGSWDGPVFRGSEPSLTVACVSLGLAGVATAAVILPRRWRRPELVSLTVVWAVALGAAMVLSLRFPLRVGIPLPYFRWVWPMAAIWTSIVAVGAWNAVTVLAAERGRATVLGRPASAGLVPTAIVVVLALGTAVPGGTSESPNPDWAQDISRRFGAAAVAAVDADEEVLVEQSIQEVALWVIPAIIDQLDAAGRPVRVADPVLVQQTDDRYRSTGDEPRRLVLRGGLQIDDAPDGATLLARHDALTAAERRELDRLRRDLSAGLGRRGAVRLTPVGRAEGPSEALDALVEQRLGVEEVLGSVPFRQALQRGAISVAGVSVVDLDRATELGARDGGRSVALYLAPR